MKTAAQIMKSKQSFKAEMDHQNRLCCDRKRCHQKYVGCPELTKIFCANDDRFYGNLPGLEFRRTGTLGTGASRCDFNIKKDEATNFKSFLSQTKKVLAK